MPKPGSKMCVRLPMQSVWRVRGRFARVGGVLAGLVPATHAGVRRSTLQERSDPDRVDGWDKPGQDTVGIAAHFSAAYHAAFAVTFIPSAFSTPRNVDSFGSPVEVSAL